MKPQVLLTEGSFVREISAHLSSLGANIHILKYTDNPFSYYQRATHILIPGGADIDPSYYNHRPTFAVSRAPARDAIEYGLASLALADAKPIMGICRGHQMICIAAGGTLYQDITRETGVPHSSPEHRIAIVRRSNLYRLLRATDHRVNSYHHQAVRDVPPGWRVAATSNGIIESIEHPRLPVISVQWHPEIIGDLFSYLLFGAFLALR